MQYKFNNIMNRVIVSCEATIKQIGFLNHRANPIELHNYTILVLLAMWHKTRRGE